jgi:site-specific recombinase XerD
MAELSPFFTMVRTFITVFLPRIRCASPNTIKSYRQAINLFRRYLQDQHGLRLDQISFDHVTRSTVTGFMGWLGGRGSSPATVNQRLMAMKSFLTWCAGEDPALIAIHLNIQQVKPARQPQKPLDYLSVQAVEALLNAPGQATPKTIRDTFMLVIMFDAAARIQEILDLRIGDVTVSPRERGVHLTGKGNKTRYVPIAQTTVEHFQAHVAASFRGEVKPDDLIFFTTRGGRRHKMSQDNVIYLMNRHADKAREHYPDMPTRIHPHQLRHARAKQLFRAGVPLAHIKEMLGHANIATTNIYAHPDPDMLAETLAKANPPGQPETYPWQNDETMILRLAGLA